MLLLLPFIQFSAKPLPYVTLSFALAILGAFVFIQLDEQAAQNKATVAYFENGLADIELPHFTRFVQKRMAIQSYYHTVEGIRNQSLSPQALYWTQAWDPVYQQALNQELIIGDDHPKYRQWRQLRRDYNFILAQDASSTYGYTTAKPQWLSAGSSMFIHTSWLHLGVMLYFLVLLGFHLEQRLGHLKVATAAIVGQAFVLSSYTLVLPYSLIPMVGADGMVACFMGLFCYFLGLQKVKFILNILHRILVISIPGLFLFPAWLIMSYGLHLVQPQVFQVLIPVISGFSCGILLGVLFKPKVDTVKHAAKEMDASYLSFQDRFNDALNKLAELNFPQAKKAFYSLHKEFPQNQEILFQLFNATKHDPSSEDYHLVVTKILSLKDNSRGAVSMINIVFQNYIRKAQPSIRFDPNVFLGLLQKFRRYGYLEDAEKILKVLVQYNKSGKLNEILAREQLLLVRSFMNKQDALKARKTLEWCQNLYPDTASAKEAKTIKLQAQ